MHRRASMTGGRSLTEGQLRFDGQVVIVTGGAGGLGRSQAIEFARRGARVVVNDLGGSPRGGGADPGLVQAVVDEIRADGGEAVANADSVASPDGGRRVVRTALDTWGRLDAIVTNAAILNSRHFEDVTIEEWDELIGVNLRGVFCSLQPAYQAMKDSGGGRIVTLTSPAGLCGAFGMSSYAASKMAVIGLMRSIAWEGGRFGVKANAVAPGAFDTRMFASASFEDASLVGRPPELPFFSDVSYFPLVTSSRVTPMIIALAHPSCVPSGEIFGAFGGHYSRFVVSQNDGILTGLEPTPEEIVARWHEIRAATPADELDQEVVGWVQKSGARISKLVSLLDGSSVPTGT